MQLLPEASGLDFADTHAKKRWFENATAAPLAL